MAIKHVSRTFLLTTTALLLAAITVLPVQARDVPAEPSPDIPIKLQQTGQLDILQSRDDGDLRLGIVWPDPRFIDNGDGTILDRLTDLVWLQDALCIYEVTWEETMDFVDGLSDGICGLSDGSEPLDWRLPNVRELHSLIDYSQFSPLLQEGHPFFADAKIPYWSSTSYHNYITDEYRWVVAFGGGIVTHGSNNWRQYRGWPVRYKKLPPSSEGE